MICKLCVMVLSLYNCTPTITYTLEDGDEHVDDSDKEAENHTGVVEGILGEWLIIRDSKNLFRLRSIVWFLGFFVSRKV